MLVTLVASAARGVVAPAFGGGDATFVGESPVVELHCDVSIGTGILVRSWMCSSNFHAASKAARYALHERRSVGTTKMREFSPLFTLSSVFPFYYHFSYCLSSFLSDLVVC